jgi:small-conductance mechanosensitive channel
VVTVLPFLAETEATEFTVQNLVNAALVLVAAYLVARTVSYVLSSLADRLVENRFRVTSLIPIAKFLVYGVALYFVTTWLFELTSTQIVAFSGLLGATLGLGLKDYLADIVGGIVVVLEKPYQVGDKVSMGEHYGEVLDIGIRSTRLVTPNDSVIVVPNFLFFDESISNANAGNPEMMVTVEFYVDPDAEVDRATEVVEEALLTSPYVYVSEQCPADVVVEDDLYYRTLTGRAYVNDLRNELDFRNDVSRRVLSAFDSAGIESPKVPAGVDRPGGET